MRSWALWVLVAVVGTALALLALDGFNCSGYLTDSVLPVDGESMKLQTNRRLKERSHVMSTIDVKRDLVSINMDDYPRFDPVPSSKAAVKSGPIEHGTPLMPYVPKPMPPTPSYPVLGGSP